MDKPILFESITESTQCKIPRVGGGTDVKEILRFEEDQILIVFYTGFCLYNFRENKLLWEVNNSIFKSYTFGTITFKKKIIFTIGSKLYVTQKFSQKLEEVQSFSDQITHLLYSKQQNQEKIAVFASKHFHVYGVDLNLKLSYKRYFSNCNFDLKFNTFGSKFVRYRKSHFIVFSQKDQDLLTPCKNGEIVKYCRKVKGQCIIASFNPKKQQYYILVCNIKTAKIKRYLTMDNVLIFQNCLFMFDQIFILSRQRMYDNYYLWNLKDKNGKNIKQFCQSIVFSQDHIIFAVNFKFKQEIRLKVIEVNKKLQLIHMTERLGLADQQLFGNQITKEIVNRRR